MVTLRFFAAVFSFRSNVSKGGAIYMSNGTAQEIGVICVHVGLVGECQCMSKVWVGVTNWDTFENCFCDDTYA